MKSFLKILLSIIIIFIIVIGAGMLYLSRGLEKGEELVINEVTPSNIEDGIYNGKYNAGRWTNEVNVIIKDHKITKIELIYDVTFKKQEVTESVISRVIENQSTNIDVVSGATVTSKAYLKSIENALLNVK